MIKEYLRKILPPPVEKVHGYRDQLLEAIEEQKTLTYMLMLRRLTNSVQKVSVSAVQSICSSKQTESLHSVK